MGDAEQAELRDNVASWISHLKKNAPMEIGAVVIFYNRRTGDVQGGATDNNPRAVVEVLRALANSISGDGQNLVIPASVLPKQ